jgi:predicted RNase H-like HicB family nuclease
VAAGATVEETERLLREAIALHLEGMKEDGIPIPEPSSVVDYLDMEACV